MWWWVETWSGFWKLVAYFKKSHSSSDNVKLERGRNKVNYLPIGSWTLKLWFGCSSKKEVKPIISLMKLLLLKWCLLTHAILCIAQMVGSYLKPEIFYFGEERLLKWHKSSNIYLFSITHFYCLCCYFFLNNEELKLMGTL